MINDFMMIDNVFDEVDSIVKYAETLKYYKLKDHPDDSNSNWIGYRSDIIGKINNDVSMMCLQQIISKTIDKSFGPQTNEFDVQYRFKSNVFFHYITENDRYNDLWRHRDSSDHVYAGVIYLSRKPKPHSGTRVYLPKGPIDVENVFNRLVLYRADYIHSAMNGYGSAVDDSRLTMNVFFNELSFRVISQREMQQEMR